MKKISSRKISQEKDLPILNFLWRWKVATTSAIYIRFQPEFKWLPFTTYKRLRVLAAKGYVQTIIVPSGMTCPDKTGPGVMISWS